MMALDSQKPSNRWSLAPFALSSTTRGRAPPASSATNSLKSSAPELVVSAAEKTVRERSRAAFRMCMRSEASLRSTADATAEEVEG